MKLTNRIIKLWLILLVLVGTNACSDDKEDFIFKRNTDALNFSYLSTTKTFSILTNGNWEVSSNNSWITLSPTTGSGDGKTREYVDVTVTQNKGDAQEGSIQLKCGEKEYKITVTQDEGHFKLQEASIEGGFYINQPVKNGRIILPYTKAATDDIANATVTLNGAGAEGLTVEKLENYQLEVGEGMLIINISGTPKTSGEIIAEVNINISSIGFIKEVTVKGRTKIDDSGIDPLESPTVTLFKCLPRLAVFDWGTYEKGSGKPRKFTIELATSQYGPAIRHYSNTCDWLSTSCIGTGNYFFEHNRFTFANLTPNTNYWFRIILHSNNTAVNLDSDMTRFEFKTPEEPTMSANTLLYKDFDNFWFGGCPIYQSFAVQPIETQIKDNLDPASDAVMATDYRTFTFQNCIASPFASSLNATNCPAMWKYYWQGEKYGYAPSATADGWWGYNIYPATGCVKIAPATNYGFLTTPKLTGIGEGTANITVTYNSAAYFEPYHPWGEDNLQELFIVEGAGTIIDGGSSMVEKTDDTHIVVQCKSNVNGTSHGPLYDYTIPTTHTIKIQGATKETRITFRSMPNTGGLHCRFWLDDILITKD